MTLTDNMIHPSFAMAKPFYNKFDKFHDIHENLQDKIHNIHDNLNEHKDKIYNVHENVQDTLQKINDEHHQIFEDLSLIQQLAKDANYKSSLALKKSNKVELASFKNLLTYKSILLLIIALIIIIFIIMYSRTKKERRKQIGESIEMNSII